MIPEFRLASEAAELDHGEGKIEAIVLGFLHNLFVELERRFVLGGVCGDEPAVVTDGDKDADFSDHGELTSNLSLENRS